MTNQAAQTMPEPVTASMCPSSDYAKGWNDCLAALSQTAGVVDGVEELRDLAPRALELAERLVMSGPKAAHVSASETHEIADFVRDTAAMLAAAPSASGWEDGLVAGIMAHFCNAIDNLNDMPVSDEWARKWTAKAEFLIGLGPDPGNQPLSDTPHPPAAASVSERARELEQAQRLAVSLWERNYKESSPDWKVDETLTGVLLQISNMVSGMAADAIEQALTQQRGEPNGKLVGWWNGIMPDVTERSPYGPSVRWGADAENSGHDIPLYDGYNPIHYTTPQPSADAVREVQDGMEELREKIEALQEFKPWAHKHPHSGKGFVTSMRKSKPPEQGEEYGWVNKGTILALLSAASAHQQNAAQGGGD